MRVVVSSDIEMECLCSNWPCGAIAHTTFAPASRIGRVCQYVVAKRGVAHGESKNVGGVCRDVGGLVVTHCVCIDLRLRKVAPVAQHDPTVALWTRYASNEELDFALRRSRVNGVNQLVCRSCLRWISRVSIDIGDVQHP